MKIDNEQEDIKVQIKKIAVFIEASDMPEEIKASLFKIMPEMELSQLDELLAVFEAKYLDEKTQDINKILIADMEKIQNEYEKKESELTEEILSELNRLKQKLDE